MLLLAALFLALHGIAHLAGARAALWPTPIQAKRRSYLGGKVEGVAWLLLSLGFCGSAALLLSRQESWTALLLGSASGSLLLCVLSWPEARIGLVIDVVLLLLVLLLAPRNGAGLLAGQALGLGAVTGHPTTSWPSAHSGRAQRLSGPSTSCSSTCSAPTILPKNERLWGMSVNRG
jgi:hypothetical protein